MVNTRSGHVLQSGLIVHVTALFEKETHTMNVQCTNNDRTPKSRRRSGWSEPQHRRPTTRHPFLKLLGSADTFVRGQGNGLRSDRLSRAQAHFLAPAPQL